MIITVSVKIWSDWVPIMFRKSKTPMDLLPEGKAPAAARPLPRIALLRCRRFRTFSRELVRSIAAADADQSTDAGRDRGRKLARLRRGFWPTRITRQDGGVYPRANYGIAAAQPSRPPTHSGPRAWTLLGIRP